MDPLIFIFIGRSGCGKGTQVKLLKEVLTTKDPSAKILHLETGVNFRKFVTGQGYSNKISQDILTIGERQPDFLAIKFWSDFFVDNYHGDEYVICDGICRSLPEAMTFSTAMHFYNRKPIVIYINVSREWSTKRLLGRSRADDDENGIQKRLDWFDKDTMPAIEYFSADSRYVFHDVNGEQTIEDVHAEIMRKLKW